MVQMKRASIAAVAPALLLAGLLPATASAKIIEVGATRPSALVAPTCPPGATGSKCTIVLTGVTALETISDGHTYPTTVNQPGYIVAFTLGLSALNPNRATALSDLRYLDKTYGTTRARLTVLKPAGTARHRSWVVTAESQIFYLQPYLGEVVQFPLAIALPVTRGEVVALTVPTWAPVLSIGLPTKKFAYRQSRTTGCTTPSITNQTQSRVGTSAVYGCNYPGTRVEYSVTEITTPPVPKNYLR